MFEGEMIQMRIYLKKHIDSMLSIPFLLNDEGLIVEWKPCGIPRDRDPNGDGHPVKRCGRLCPCWRDSGTP
jgi:hypothetical protein